ncbi:hypothetical protein [Parenemella sanctibonifatiensis]|uniref:DUF4352 domain-containing protein n=1 Tax=Parenemella sanctibonifatiensis TaxID=2016505 RepID=A0A255EMD9_9ACTN|nr:hypothetical protein [Parenemella sanctibonifatiensis]OYN92674.1 hypothetical protein CGZ91_04175 [Parenemella sanctibonifatiensis]
MSRITSSAKLARLGAGLAAAALVAVAGCSQPEAGGEPTTPVETTTVEVPATTTPAETTSTSEPSSSETSSSESSSSSPETSSSSGAEDRPLDSVQDEVTVGETVKTPFWDVTVKDYTRAETDVSLELEVCNAYQPEDREDAEITLDHWYLIAYDGETSTPEDAKPIALSEFENLQAGDFEGTLSEGECTSDTVTLEVAPDIIISSVAFSDGRFEDGANQISWSFAGE